MARKMSKAVRQMVESVNEYLKARNICDESNDLFNHTCMLLSRLDCYPGFLFYKKVWSDQLDRWVPKSCTREDCEYLQFLL